MPIARHQFGLEPNYSPKNVLTPADLYFQFGSTRGDTHGRIVGHSTADILHEYRKGIEFVSHPQVVMQDWDLPGPIHALGSVTIAEPEEALRVVDKFTNEYPSAWQMYRTPGGIRAYRLDAMEPPSRAEFYRQNLNSDPLYTQFATERNKWATRISGKPKRLNDYVAEPFAIVGNTSLVQPDILDYITRFHDIPILENRFVSGVKAPIITPTGRIAGQ